MEPPLALMLNDGTWATPGIVAPTLRLICLNELPGPGEASKYDTVSPAANPSARSRSTARATVAVATLYVSCLEAVPSSGLFLSLWRKRRKKKNSTLSGRTSLRDVAVVATSAVRDGNVHVLFGTQCLRISCGGPLSGS